MAMTRILAAIGLQDRQVLQLCRATLGTGKIFASCFYGPRVYGYADEKSDINVLLIVSNYTPKMNDFAGQLEGANFFILAVDKELFETDVAKGKLGGLIAEIVTLPYQPWRNADYLEDMEVKIKKRIAIELLRDIVLKYPEMSTEILVQPEYFMYEVMRRKAKLFSPSIYSFSSIFKGRAKKQNVDLIMKGYLKALEELCAEKQVVLTDGYVRVDKDFVETTRRNSKRLSNILLSIQKALLPYIQGISETTTVFLRNQRLLKKRAFKKTEEEMLKRIEETEKYLLIPTPLGPVPLSDKTSIQDIVRKAVPGGEKLEMEVEEMGGVLNSVFLLRLQRNHETQKIVVKKFEDWLGFKWFPLALWALGTQSFAVLGATRLEREYAINQVLRKNGFNVPRILYVSLKERLIFEEFVEGEKISETVKRIIASSPRRVAPSDAEIINAVGKEIAKVHLVGIALGDCKPENVLLMNDKVCFLDLEQATRNGNQPWDIAEFLYYSGHYILPIHSDKAARTIASSFIDGYLEAGGKSENIRKAASAKYTKVFSIFTLPNITLTIANACRKMGTEKN
jgi:tRNA A-37 threonylcarbamoyl transferase component Bud32